MDNCYDPRNFITQSFDAYFSFKSPETFKKFAESRSWEPGWLADFRKDCWDSFSALPEKIIKDERWRFSPKVRFSFDSINGLADPKNSLIIETGSSEDGIFLHLLDRLILDQPHALAELPKMQGPELGAQEYSLLTGAFAETGFLLPGNGIHSSRHTSCDRTS